MKEIYNSFRLMGYKINETSGSSFIAQRPDGKIGLFDSNGNLIRGNLDSIRQFTEEVYGGFEGADAVLFNKEGSTLDIVHNKSHMRFIGTIDKRYSYIQVYNSDSGNHNIHSLDGKVQFKGIEGHIYGLVYNNGKYKLLHNKNGLREYYESIKTIDMQGNIEVLDAYSYNFLIANNQYIAKSGVHRKAEIIDFQGNIICAGEIAVIDEDVLDNDIILVANGYYLEIKSSLQAIDMKHKCCYKIKGVRFTDNKDIVWITDDYGTYMLNIKTEQTTDYYTETTYMHNNIIYNRTNDNHTDIYRLNLGDFSTELVAHVDNYLLLGQYIVLINNDKKTYYDFDLQPLIHEFD